LALYVHLPWCVRKCPYCDFNSHAVGEAGIPEGDYIAALLRDLDAECARLAAGPARPLIAIFIGGGTPSLFSGAAIRRLLEGIRARIAVVDTVEVTLEANPGTVDADHFLGYAEAGVNRLSIGVQSLCDASLRGLGRIHCAADARRAVEAARAAGIDNLNLDLMFALPGQTLAAARADLAALLALEPAHISYYELTLEPNTAFYQQPPVLPDPDLADAIQQQGLAMLKQAGFERYEVSAFARPGRRCQHNLNYWRFGDYLGLGAGAHGKRTDAASGRVERCTKQRQPSAYLKACRLLDAGTAGAATTDEPVLADPTRSAWLLSEQDLLLEFALNAFRLAEGFSRTQFERHTGLDAARLRPGLQRASDLGLLEINETVDRVRPTARGFAFLNELIGCFAEA
jgi:oxygen-independent coproporphyrinogen-3 oxidase